MSFFIVLQFFSLFSLFFMPYFVKTTFHLDNLVKTGNFARGTIFVEFKNEFHTLLIDKKSFGWLKNNSRQLCETFMKIPIFYGLVEYFFDKNHKSQVEIVKYEECCE